MNYTDSLTISRAKLVELAVNGSVTLFLGSDVPGNALSQSADGGIRLSPVTLAYPLMFCYLKAVKSGVLIQLLDSKREALYFFSFQFHEWLIHIYVANRAELWNLSEST